MAFYIIRDSGVYSAPTLKLLNKKYQINMSMDEFVVTGRDFVSILSNRDFAFVQDKQKMENLLFAGFFRKDNSAKLLAMVNLIFTFILLVIVSQLKSAGGIP